jgi:hypothetical protein
MLGDEMTAEDGWWKVESRIIEFREAGVSKMSYMPKKDHSALN